jgi:hypothetical protein
MAFFTPSAPASGVKAAAVLPVAPPSAVALVSVVVARRRAPVSAANARRGAALVARAALDDLRPAIDADLRAYLESQIVTSDQVRVRPLAPHPLTIPRPGRSRTNSVGR